MRIIIAGTRTFSNYTIIAKETDKLIADIYKNHAIIFNSEIEIISGHARGVDMTGESYARNNNYKLSTFPADWDMYGKSAGYRRNEQMACYAYQDPSGNALLAFWDGKSVGTKHMIDLAKRYNLNTVRVITV